MVLPTAVIVALSPFTKPVIVASVFIRLSPLYTWVAEPVVTVSGAGRTVSVPFSVETDVKREVTLLPSGPRMT